MVTLVSIAPLAGAIGDGSQDGHLSRTFLSQGSINWVPHSTNPGDGVGGVGWYHPDDRDGLCALRLFGLDFAVGYYYEMARIATVNPYTTVATVPETTVSGDPCALDPSVSSGQVVGTSEATVNVGSKIYQSSLYCTKTFSLCSVDGNTARWFLYDCAGVDNVEFGSGDILGTLTVQNSISPTIGSSHLIDGCSGSRFDASSYLSKQLNGLSSLSNVPLQYVARETTYIMSCYSVEYDVFPENVRNIGTSHDYFLAIDDDVLVTDLLHFANAPRGPASGKYSENPNSVALQGWYDLSGNNYCSESMGSVSGKTITRELIVPNGAKCSCNENPNTCNIDVEFLKLGDTFEVTKNGKRIGGENIINPLDAVVKNGANYEVFYSAPAVVTLVSTAGGDVKGCHLQQDIINRFGVFGNGNEDDDGIKIKDYSSTTSVGNIYYGGWWLYDRPYRHSGPSPKANVWQKYFWQAEVFVEEAKTVKTYWGFQYNADLDNEIFVEEGRFNGNQRNNPYD